MADKPRLLVIERDSSTLPEIREALSEGFELVVARSVARGLVLLRQHPFVGVYVDAAQLAAVRWAGVLIQADEILDAIADGVAVVDPSLKIIWANSEFQSLVDRQETEFYRALGSPKCSVRIRARLHRLCHQKALRARCCGLVPIVTCA